MGAAQYLQTSYYEHWLHAFETMAMEKGILTAEELRTGHAIGEGAKTTPALAPEAVPKIVLMGSSARVDMDVLARSANFVEAILRRVDAGLET